jgi:methylthioribose-1-phosphate isomerase
LEAHLDPIFTHLSSSRPTAVNLGQAITPFTQSLEAGRGGWVLQAKDVAGLLVKEGRQIADEDVGRNREMSRHGAEWIIAQVEKRRPGASANGLNVMTVCNTGSLATSVCDRLALLVHEWGVILFLLILVFF